MSVNIYRMYDKNGIVTNNYDVAAKYVGRSRNTFRRVLKNGAGTKSFSCKYITGGGVSQ